MTPMANDDLKALIRTIADFPKPGIQFRDITTLLLDPLGLKTAIDRMATATIGPVDLVAGIEARGFLFAAALAVPLNAGVVLIRKDGKLPGATIAEDYALEYGQDRRSHRDRRHRPRCCPVTAQGGRGGRSGAVPHRSARSRRGSGARG